MLTDVVIANKSYTKLMIPANVKTDAVALKVIRRDCPEFLLPMRAMEIDGELEVRYELLEGSRLSYLPRRMSKREVSEFLVRMLTPFKTCGDWFLDYHNFLLDENYILVGKDGSSVRYIYLPAEEYAESDEKIRDFFMNLLLNTDISDDPGYMLNLLRVLKSPDANLMSLLEYFQKETASREGAGQPERKPAAPEKPAPAASFAAPPEKPQERKGFPPVMPAKAPETGEGKKEAVRPGTALGEFGKNDEAGRLMGSLFGDQEEPKKEKEGKKKKVPKEKNGKGGLFGLFKGKQKEEPEKEAPLSPAGMPETPAPADRSAALPFGREEREQISSPFFAAAASMELGDETAIMDSSEESDGNVLRLCLEGCMGCRCPETVEVELKNGAATVGRADKNGMPQADYNFDAALSFVSRRHFRVEKAEDGWRIIDIGSTNGTALNGNILVPNMPYPLAKGDTVSINCNKRRLAYRVC